MNSNRLLPFLTLLLINSNTVIAQKARPKTSNWVSQDKNGQLHYTQTPAGDRIIDFSHAGYMGGGAPIPTVQTAITLKPSGEADDTKQIQAALDSVGKLSIKNGVRGAVLLLPGQYTCSSTLHILQSGVVLRGSGQNETHILMAGDKHTAIIIGQTSSSQRAQDHATEEAAQPQTETVVTQTYIPFGSSVFSVADASLFKAGDTVDIVKPITDKWIHFMKMDNLVRDGKKQRWIGNNRYLNTSRVIKSISGNQISLDVPLADSYNQLYTQPNGTRMIKRTRQAKVMQAGVEGLHIQCRPLEIAYSEAPYAGIRINGDDCWVRNIFFEETMNTSTLAGNRITMQNITIKHSFPNLGASKPADFSFEGSQNLVDRCRSTGGNTYFVWTSSLVPGPNVVLNSVFQGHGSRLQPHQRWSTALLIDNCSIVEGHIDFLNRGVAGSGHGWTMG